MSSRLKNIIYPTEMFISEVMASKSEQSYLLGSNGFWHNGIHLLTRNPLKAITDGTIVAMRISDDYKTSYYFDEISGAYRSLYLPKSLNDNFDKLFDKKNDMYKMKEGLSEEDKRYAYYLVDELYSNDFILFEYIVKNAARKEIKFYGLYNHLKPAGTMTVHQKLRLPYYDKVLKADKKEEYYYIEAYENYENKTNVIKVPSETQVKEDQSIQISWKLNGEKFSGFIDKKYVRTFKDGRKEIKRRFVEGSTVGKKSDYLDAKDISKYYDNKSGTALFSSGDREKRQVTGIVDINSKLRIADKKEFEEISGIETGIKVEAKDENGTYSGFVYLDESELSRIQKDYAVWKKKQQQETEVYSFCKKKHQETEVYSFCKKEDSAPSVAIKNISMISGESVIYIGDGKIPCETAVTEEAVKQYNWNLNGETHKGYIDEKYVRNFQDHSETKRYPREGETFSANYLPQGYEKKEKNAILVYTTEQTATRTVKAVLPVDTEFYINETENLDKYISNYEKERGLEVCYKQKGVINKGFIFFGNFETEFKNEYKEWKKEVTHKMEDTKTVGGMFTITVKLKEGIELDKVCVPVENNLKKGTVCGYTEYTSPTGGEESTSIHLEIFTEDIKFMSFSQRDKCSFSYKINSRCTLRTGKLITVTKQKKINFRPLIGFEGIPENEFTHIFNSPSASYKNGVIQYLGKGQLVQNEVYHKVQFAGRAFFLSDNEYVERTRCFGEWIEEISSWVGESDIQADLYDNEGTIIKGRKIAIYKNINYKYKSKKEIADGKRTIKLRQAERYYELYNESKKSEIFYVTDETFNSFKMISKKADLYYVEKLPCVKILEKPIETKWTEEAVSKDSGTLIHKSGVTREYYSYEKQGVKRIWEEVEIENDANHYWLDRNSINENKGGRPVEKIIYDKWDEFFTELRELASLGTKLEETDENLSKLGLNSEQIETYKESREREVRYKLSNFINYNRIFENRYFHNETEWKKNDEITNALCRYSQNEERIKKIKADYEFWDEAKKMKNKDFPITDNLFFFYPPAFLQHLDKVATIPEFNPYENFKTVPRLGRGLGDEQYVFKTNPGFAPYCETTDRRKFVIEEEHGGKTVYFADLNCPYGYSNAYGKDKNGNLIWHTGIDFPGTNDIDVKYAPIMALVRGRIWACTSHLGRVDENKAGRYGRLMIIKGDNDRLYLLAHLQDFAGHKEGDYVSPGDVVAHAGNTGHSLGQHLHIEMIKCKLGMDNDSWGKVLDRTYNQLHEADGGIKGSDKSVLKFNETKSTGYYKGTDTWKGYRLNPLTGEKK